MDGERRIGEEVQQQMADVCGLHGSQQSLPKGHMPSLEY